MPKYDAFGREIGEDTLQGLGEPSSGTETDWRETEPVPAKTPQPEPAQPQPTPPAQPEFVTKAADEEQRREMAAQLTGVLQQAATRSTGVPTTVTVRRSGSAKGCLVAIVVVLLIGGAVIAGIASFVSNVSDEVGKITLPEINTGPKPTGFTGESMMRPAALGAALAKLRADESTKLTHLRVAPDRIDAQLLTDEGRLRSVQFKPGGEMEQLGSDSGPGFDKSSTIPYARLRPGVPQRLARQGAKKLGVPVSTVQYAVPSLFGDELTWAVYFEHARYVIGDARGRFQRAY